MSVFWIIVSLATVAELGVSAVVVWVMAFRTSAVRMAIRSLR